jgi:hypothetical protein
MSDIDISAATDALTAELPDVGGFEPIVSDEAVSEDNLPVEAESFTGFDPSVLPEDMQQVYRSMQADYTRKTQEIAEKRREYEAFSEAGIDPNEALEAASLWQRMNNEPDFARSISQDIQNRLEELGYTNEPKVADVPVNNGYEGLPPEVAKELQEMRQFREEMVQQQEQQQVFMEIEAAEQTIRTTNPNYTDSDMDAIYSLAYSTQGDLMAAQEMYHQIQQNLLGSYLQAKTVPHGATPAPGGPSSVPPKEFGSLDDAHKAAMEAVRNIS